MVASQPQEFSTMGADTPTSWELTATGTGVAMFWEFTATGAAASILRLPLCNNCPSGLAALNSLHKISKLQSSNVAVSLIFIETCLLKLKLITVVSSDFLMCSIAK